MNEILTRACELYVVKQVQNDRIEYEVKIIEFENELIWRFENVHNVCHSEFSSGSQMQKRWDATRACELYGVNQVLNDRIE